MTTLRVVITRLADVFRRERHEQQLRDEIQSHLEHLSDEYQRGGMSPAEADAAARRAFGRVELIKETYRDQRGFSFIDSLRQDLRLAVRSMRREPGASVSAIAILALGTGLNTAVCAVAYGILLRPLPYPEPARLVQFYRDTAQTQPLLSPLIFYEAWQPRFHSLDVAGYTTSEFTLRGVGDPRVIRAALVTERFFDVLGVAPLSGRPTLEGSTPTVVLSAELGATLLNDTGGSLPSSVRLGPTDYLVAAVMPKSVTFPAHVDAWLPLRAAPTMQVFGRQQPNVYVIGRVKRDFTLEQAREDVRRVFVEITQREPRFGPIVSGTTVTPLLARLTEPARPILIAFTSAAILVLLLACANVASLLIASAIPRGHETAVRLALGARRLRVLRMHLIEGGLLVLIGSSIGVALAYAAVRAFVATTPRMLPRQEDVTVDGTVLTVSLVVAAAVTVLCALAPGLHAIRTPLTSVFAPARIGRPRTARRLTSALVVLQLVISSVLLVGAGLLIRTVVGLARTDLGIRTQGALAVELMIAEATGQRAPGREPFVADLLASVRRAPGVQAAAVGSALPTTGSFGMSVSLDRADNRTANSQFVSVVAASEGYFAALGIPIHAGRDFDRQDEVNQEAVGIVNAALAEELFPAADAIGRELPVRIQSTRPGRPRIIGVVGNVKREPTAGPLPTVYVPWRHLPAGDVHLVIRTDQDPTTLLPTIRQLIRDLDPAQPIGTAQPLDEALSSLLAGRRVYAYLATSLAVLALTIAAIGLAAVLSRMVAARRRELSIRSALGASPRDARGLVMRDGVMVGLLGLTLGLGAAVAAARGLAALLYGVSPGDPLTYVTVAVTVAVTVVCASYVPARAAARAEPSELMRVE